MAWKLPTLGKCFLPRAWNQFFPSTYSANRESFLLKPPVKAFNLIFSVATWRQKAFYILLADQLYHLDVDLVNSKWLSRWIRSNCVTFLIISTRCAQMHTLFQRPDHLFIQAKMLVEKATSSELCENSYCCFCPLSALSLCLHLSSYINKCYGN